MDQLRTKIDDYNTALVAVDSASAEIKMLEKNLGDLADQMLTAVAFKYGKDSREYEMAGGVPWHFQDGCWRNSSMVAAPPSIMSILNYFLIESVAKMGWRT